MCLQMHSRNRRFRSGIALVERNREAALMIFRGFDSNDKKCYSIGCKDGDSGNHGDENDLWRVIFGLPAVISCESLCVFLGNSLRSSIFSEESDNG